MKIKKKLKKFMKNPQNYCVTIIEGHGGTAIPVLVRGPHDSITRIVRLDISVNIDGTVQKLDLAAITAKKVELHFGGFGNIILHYSDGRIIHCGFEDVGIKFSALIVTETAVACCIFFDSEFMFAPMVFFVQGEDRIVNFDQLYCRILQLGFCEGVPAPIKESVDEEVASVRGKENQIIENE